MRVLLATLGSRGDVQPLVALAESLKALRAEVRLCVPPDFREWIEGRGFPVVPIGSELRPAGSAGPSTAAAAAAPPTPEERRRAMERTLAVQFETLAEAARGCDLLVGAAALKITAPSVAEKMGIPHVFVAYSPSVLPSPHHPPPAPGGGSGPPPPEGADHSEGWAAYARQWNEAWGSMLNDHRAALGLGPVTDVHRYVLTPRPWLAADPALAPWPDPADPSVFQTGAWIFPDERPLPPDLEAFLDAGEPPVYFGFGSSRAPEALGRVMIESARAAGRRAIVSRGWAGLSAGEGARDCFAIDDVNHPALFARVAAVAHHGGAGTTTAAARAGAPQVVIPQGVDQHDWARRVHDLGIGVAHAPGAPTAESLASALEQALRPGVAAHARCLAGSVRGDGARIAAERLVALGREGRS